MIPAFEKQAALDGSYKIYRETLKIANPPAIPYLGVSLSDLVFINDGNPDFLSELINLEKCNLIYKVISEVERFQATDYKVDIYPSIYYYVSKGFHYLADADLYSLSTMYEPRGCTQKDVL